MPVVTYQTIRDDPAGLEELIDEMEDAGYDWAAKKAAYYAAKNKNVLELKAKGMAATTINDVIKGVDEVNSAMFHMDCAEVLYKACHERVMARKLNLRNINEQSNREMYG